MYLFLGSAHATTMKTFINNYMRLGSDAMRCEVMCVDKMMNLRVSVT